MTIRDALLNFIEQDDHVKDYREAQSTRIHVLYYGEHLKGLS